MHRGAACLHYQDVIIFLSEFQWRPGRSRCCRVLLLDISFGVAHVEPPTKTILGKTMALGRVVWKWNRAQTMAKMAEVHPYPCTGLDGGGEEGDYRPPAAAPA